MVSSEIKGFTEELSDMSSIGTDNVIKCIKNIGQYIIDNAEKIGKNAGHCLSINIKGNVSMLESPTVEVIYHSLSKEKLEEIYHSG